MMAYKYKILLWLAPLVLILDQFTKFLVLKFMPIGDHVGMIAGFFDLVHVRNTGAAFGLLANMPEMARIPFFFGISGIAICAMFYIYRHLDMKDRFYPWPLALVSGGIMGNFIDRLRFGNVVDFVSLHMGDRMLGNIRLEWPAFNVADSAITISMVLMAAHVLKRK